jgi:hypothetical protein
MPRLKQGVAKESEMQMKEVYMKHRAAIISVAVIVAMICVAGCDSQQKSGASAQQSSSNSAPHVAKVSWSGTYKAEVQDPAYGSTAFTLDVPTGWKFAGTILRPGGCHPPAYPAAGLSYTSLGPDGVSAFEQLPGVSWTWASNGYNFMGAKCPSNMKIDSAAGFLLNIAVPTLHPDAKSVTMLPLDSKFQAALVTNSQQATDQLRRNGLQGKAFQDAAQVRVEFERNGQQLEELEFAVIDCQEAQAQAAMGRPYTRLICNSRGTAIMRAPMGHLDDLRAHKPAFQQINQAWDQRVIHDMQSNFQQMQEASNRQFQAMTQHYADVNQNLLARSRAQDAQRAAGTAAAMRADANTQAAIDHSAQRTVQYSLDRQTFINPSTGQKIEASSEYNHQWLSSDGSTLIQTQNPSLDPNGVVYPVQQSWTELIPAN